MRIARFPLALVAFPTLLLLTGCQSRHPSPTTTEATPNPTSPPRPAGNREPASTAIIASPLGLTATPSVTAHPAPDSPTAPWDPRLFELTLDQPRPASTATTPPTLIKFSDSQRILRQSLPRFDRPGDDVVHRWIQQRRGGTPDLIDDRP